MSKNYFPNIWKIWHVETQDFTTKLVTKIEFYQQKDTQKTFSECLENHPSSCVKKFTNNRKTKSTIMSPLWLYHKSPFSKCSEYFKIFRTFGKQKLQMESNRAFRHRILRGLKGRVLSTFVTVRSIGMQKFMTI